MKGNWIWLDEKIYPDCQNSFYTMFCQDKSMQYTVAEFQKTYEFDKEIKTVTISAAADVKYILYANGKYIATGMVCRGGDYAFKGVMPYVYYDTYIIEDCGKTLDLFAKVQLLPIVETEVSSGHGGFCLEAEITFADGSKKIVNTDETWLSRRDNTSFSGSRYFYEKKKDVFVPAVVTPNIWTLKKSPIEPLCEEKIYPEFYMTHPVAPHSELNVTVYFDKVYSCFPAFKVKAKGEFEIRMNYFEYAEPRTWYDVITGNCDIEHRCHKMQSVGGIRFEIVNKSDYPVTLEDVHIYFVHYPVTMQGSFECNDPTLNKIYEIGAHTLKICLQTLELDSPRHQENLGCTGDYFLETIFNSYTFGKLDVSRFDITRTADLMRVTDARMYHTAYSLIWVQMILYYYNVTGDINLVHEVKDMLLRLMERFDSYTGENNLIEKPYDFMFIDWIFHDGHSMHHPPKALGQGPMNAFYYKALTDGAQICNILGDFETASLYSERAKKVRNAFNELLFDQERALYIAGLGTAQELPDDGEFDDLMPQNVDKKYFGMHTNALAVLYGICPLELEKDIMTKVMEDETLITVQPYFMHFVLEALYKAGLYEKYGLKTLYRWKRLIDICPKAMREGWIDMPGYGYDFSHAWGCTPTYQLPSKILGLEILEPKFKKISVKPDLFGLEFANIKVPTPYGAIEACITKDKAEINAPEEIEVIYR